MSERRSGQERQRKSSASQIAQGYRLAHEVISAAVSMVLMVGAGYWLDEKFGWSPFLTIVGACFGFVAAGASLRVLVQRLDRESEARKKNSASSGEAKSE